MYKLTLTNAEVLAQELLSDGNAVGICHESFSHGYVVGIYYTDGRTPKIKGQSKRNWESAFCNIALADPTLEDKVVDLLNRYAKDGK